MKYIQMDDEKVKAKINDNLGGINFKHVFDKTIFSIGAKYGIRRLIIMDCLLRMLGL